MEGFTFSTDVRVRFADTDAQGIAHNASYLVWFEVARVEYLRAHAGGYQTLRDVGIDAELSPMPQEVPDPIPFPDDRVHAAYEPHHAHRFWRVLTCVEPVLAEYRAAFRGRTTPVHFFWGSMDLAVTRFSGKPCDPPDGADFLIRGSHDAEQVSIGWWAGSPNFPEPAFYAYSYPEADGIADVTLAPAAAFFSAELGEHILRYDDVRTLADPGAAVHEFLDSFFTVSSTRCAWDSTLRVDA